MRKIFARLKLAAHILRYGRLPADGRAEMRSLEADEIAEIKEFFPMPKFFIFGHARSGTTLLARLLRLHPQVHCNWQAHFFTRPPLLRSLVADADVAAWLSRRSNRWNRGADLSPLVMRAASDFILERDARQAGKNVVGDKSPNSLLNGQAVSELHAVYPDAKLVFIVRDGRDVLVSHRFQQFIDIPDHLSKEDLAIRQAVAENPNPFINGDHSVFTSKWITQAAQGWVRNVQETDQLARELFADQYLCMRFEDLLNQPYVELANLWELLEVDATGLEDVVATEMSSNPDADWQLQKAGGLVAQLEKGKQGSWQDLFTQQDRETFKEIAGDMLITWEYEEDLNW
jgi:hypothetical protein